MIIERGSVKKKKKNLTWFLCMTIISFAYFITLALMFSVSIIIIIIIIIIIHNIYIALNTMFLSAFRKEE